MSRVAWGSRFFAVQTVNSPGGAHRAHSPFRVAVLGLGRRRGPAGACHRPARAPRRPGGNSPGRLPGGATALTAVGGGNPFLTRPYINYHAPTSIFDHC